MSVVLFVVSNANTIALIDQKISQDEDSLLKVVYRVHDHQARVESPETALKALSLAFTPQPSDFFGVATIQ
ncbi:hypothetical protein [Acaryochloris sp. CCMEE 5410]|uniref:hypothetical protein n=1 Tax=Acaryochloris sp. CCMEE 5410 TaxID=310037 RepID=UPI0002483F1E|nr:hypothetical protein [Acaryochloris sp. CCMEE 5410]KAI9133011.1 hypothetical protein ON05_006480 [Acaryochloris sp. CCMEE 5410]